MPAITIRHPVFEDLTDMQKLFVDTISAICKDDYSPKQIKVWISSIKNTQRWIDKLTTQYCLIAELDNKMVGYTSLENNNYLDLLYVHKDYQRQGIASQLYDKIEKEAILRKTTILKSDVSQTAKAFFVKKGFQIVKKQVKLIDGIEIINFKMLKCL